MKIGANTIAYIQNVVKTARIAKIDSVVIEASRVSGMDENRTAMIFHTQNIPEIECSSIGLNRLDVFLSRFELVKGLDNLVIEAVMPDPNTTNGNAHFARSLHMKGKGIKIDYRCANPATIPGPKGTDIKDVPKYTFEITPDIVQLLAKADAAMGGDFVKVTCINNQIILELTDINGDCFTYELPNLIKCLSDETEQINFEYTYLLKIMLPLFKAADNPTIKMFSRGPMFLKINQLDVYIINHVDKR